MKGKPRIHWFWRSVIATVVASGYVGLSIWFGYPGGSLHEFVMEVITEKLTPAPTTQGAMGSMPPAWVMAVSVTIAWFLPIILLAFSVFGLLSLWRRPFAGDGETRCRRCGYILRGLREPVCSECGEAI